MINWTQYQNKELRKYKFKKFHSEILPVATGIILGMAFITACVIVTCDYIVKQLFIN